MNKITLYYIDKTLADERANLTLLQCEHMYWDYELDENPNNRKILEKLDEIKSEIWNQGTILQELNDKRKEFE